MARKSPTASGAADTTPAAPMPPAPTQAPTVKATTNPQARIAKLFATLRELISSAPEADRATALAVLGGAEAVAGKLFRGNPNPGAKPVPTQLDRIEAALTQQAHNDANAGTRSPPSGPDPRSVIVRGATAGADPEVVRNAINAATRAPSAVAIRALPTGDLKVSFATVAAAGTFAKSTPTVRQTCGAQAVARQAPTRVIVHNINYEDFDFKKETRESALRKLAERNRHLTGFASIGWNTRPRLGKKAGALVVGFESPTLANKAIEQGIAWGHQLCRVETWISTGQVTQCYRCSAYGHTATRCSRPARCGFCAKEHEVRECQRNPQKAKCANCRGNHTSWDMSCSVKTEAVRRAALARAQKPRLFPTDAPTTTTSAASPQDGGWTQVGSGRKRQRSVALPRILRPRTDGPANPPPRPSTTNAAPTAPATSTALVPLVDPDEVVVTTIEDTDMTTNY